MDRGVNERLDTGQDADSSALVTSPYRALAVMRRGVTHSKDFNCTAQSVEKKKQSSSIAVMFILWLVIHLQSVCTSCILVFVSCFLLHHLSQNVSAFHRSLIHLLFTQIQLPLLWNLMHERGMILCGCADLITDCTESYTHEQSSDRGQS